VCHNVLEQLVRFVCLARCGCSAVLLCVLHCSAPSHCSVVSSCLVGLACYGRLAVVSDVDDGGFALNVDKELRGSAVL
jgi:hypothetical protein